MKYLDGTEIQLGDTIELSNGEEGIVVLSIDTDEYSPSFPKKDWEYLKEGIMVETNNGALIHYSNNSVYEKLNLKCRKAT